MNNSDFKDEDLAGLTKDHSYAIDYLKEKMDKCYSSERYEDFQTAVRKIVDEQIKMKWIYGIFIWILTTIITVVIGKYLGK